VSDIGDYEGWLKDMRARKLGTVTRESTTGDTPRATAAEIAARAYEHAREELAKAATGLPVSVDVSETGRATLVFRMDWRLARRVLRFCRVLNVFEEERENNTPTVTRTDVTVADGES
jgi:hypothetical protein